MFTGLIECIGTVRRASGSSPRRITVASSIPTDEVALGDSIAIDGCCLTVVEKAGETLTFEAATETLKRTTLETVVPGAQVNLERALRLGDRLDGHLVTGHVDGVALVRSREQKDSALYLGIEPPRGIVRLIAGQGSIAVAGVSLTVTEVTDALFFVGLIPHTLAMTTLRHLGAGAKVNVEVDLIARYVERLAAADSQPQPPALTRQFLADKGFL